MQLNPGGVSLKEDTQLVDAIKSIFDAKRGSRIKTIPAAVIESGTYHGLGTTMNVIKGIEKSSLLPTTMPKFITIEANENNWKIAKENLKTYKWIECLHGCSVDSEKAIEWMKQNHMLNHHEDYPHLKIDSSDPVSFYSEEVKGQLFVFGAGERGQENLFDILLPKFKGHRPLIILDSCGGTGYFEFQKVMEHLTEKRFYLFLHDIEHIKHYRSAQDIRRNDDKRWQVLSEKPGEWILALRKGLG